MSFPFYGKMWIATKEDLKNVILCEKVLTQLEPTMQRNYAHELIGNLYVRYIVLCNNLSELYDQTLQVQKRELIEKLLISSQERLSEIQKDIRKIEMSQFVYADDALIELNLVPYDIEFLRPFYFPRKRSFEYQQVLDEVPKLEEKVEKPRTGLDKYRIILTPEEIEAQRQAEILKNAVNVIKSHEKARQTRVFDLNMKHFPDVFKPPEPPREKPIEYDFQHHSDQAPLFKMKRSKYHIDLYAKPINIVKYDFYEPPKFRFNKLGKKVLVPKKKIEYVDEDSRKSKETETDTIELINEDNKEAERKAADEFILRQNNAARVIQRNYLHYQLKKAIQRRKVTRLELYGMIEEPVDLDVITVKEIQERHKQKRRERKKEFDETFLKALEDEKARILKMKSEFIMEDITDDIRAWFQEFYKYAKDFHRYPEEFEGGTIMVMRGETKTAEEFLIEKNKSKEEKAREKEAKKKEKKQKKADEKREIKLEQRREMQRKKLELKQGPTWNFAEMKEWKAFENLENDFISGHYDWQLIDELKNRKEQPIWEWVTLDAFCDVHKELRLIVDNFMRVELELLRIALAIDTKTKYVPPKPKKEKKKKKKGKEKEIVDVTEGRSIEECYEELKKWNIIKKYQKKSLRDFIGDCSYATYEHRLANIYPDPHYGDIKNYIQTEILGTAARLKSFCIIGPRKCGKKFLVEAICTEMDAVMFDLSAPKIKQVDGMPYFLNLVMQMAVKFQPSVLFIDGVHKPFIRRISDEIKSEDPRKLGRYLFKDVVKNLTNDDAVILIGTTNEPSNCNFFQLRQCFEKFAVFPAKLDFGTAIQAWKTGLKLKRIINFDVSPLAEVTRSFSVGDILDAIDSCLDLKRRMMLHWKPLTRHELLENLITTKQQNDEKVIKEFNNFYLSLDPHYGERTMTMKRVQIAIDKEKEERRKKKEMQKKKEEKLAQEKKKS